MTHRFAARAVVAGVTITACLAASTSRASLSEEAAFQIATEAYIYGYPLVTMELTRRVMTNVAAPNGKLAPMGRFAHLRTYPSPDDKKVTAPNADTLYSLAWLDLASEPFIVGLPDEKGRYFLMPMLSGWTDVFAVPGTRTTGTGAQTYAVTGPGWQGTLPTGVKELRSPTRMVWIIGRTYCTGAPEDYKAVHAIQDAITLVPLSAYGTAYSLPAGKVDPAVDMTTPVRTQVNRMEASAYFKLLAALLKDNPPARGDAAIVAQIAKIGIVPGQDFDWSQRELAEAKGIERAPEAGLKAIMAHPDSSVPRVNGWTYSFQTGLYGTEYAHRAYVTAVGLGANRPEDAVYPNTKVDGDGKPLSGGKRYRIRFARGQTPPVDGFWSLTLYDPSYFFVPNPLARYTLSPRDALKYETDGSLTLSIESDPPGQDQQSNWLPAPRGNFILMLRLYWPKEFVLDGSWKPPAVEAVSAP